MALSIYPFSIIATWLCILILPLSLQGQVLYPHTLSQEDGLLPADAYHVSRDSKGMIWIGTQEGLLKYDGKQIRKFVYHPDDSTSLLENTITSQFFEDQAGNFWFTTTGSLSYYDQELDHFHSYQLERELKNYHLFHDDGKGTLWLRIGLGEEGALYLFDIQNKAFKQSIALPGEECTVVKDQSGEVTQLISTKLPNKAGLVWIDLLHNKRKHIEFLQLSDDGGLRSRSSPTRGAFVDETGTIWAGIYAGIGRYHPGDSIGYVDWKRDRDKLDGIKWVYDIIPYQADQWWVATTDGLLVFDPKKRMFTEAVKGLEADLINSIYYDSTHTIWLSGDQKISFAQVGKNKFSVIPDFSTSVANLTYGPDGNIWCSTVDSGIYIFNEDKKELLHSSQLFIKTANVYTNLIAFPHFIQNQKEEWWANAFNYFYLWNPDINSFEINDRLHNLNQSSSRANQVNYCYRLENGKNLVAWGNQVDELYLNPEDSARRLPWYNLSYLQLGNINVIYQDQNQYIYIGDEFGRLVILKEENGELQKVADLESIGTCNGFQESSKDSLVWIATSNGLVKLSLPDFQLNSLINTNEPLSSLPFYNLIIDDSGYLWLSSSNGLVRYSPTENSFHQFTAADGLLSNSLNRHAFFRSKKTGEIWVGSEAGINVFHPDSVKFLEAQPPVEITEILINDEPFDFKKSVASLERLRLKYRNNTLSFQFVALDFSDPGSNQFYYQLEGYDEERVFNNNQGFARYANLPKGYYTFKIWANNSDGVWNEAPLALPIRIIPPFYQTLWFYLLCLLAISSIVYGIFQYRLQQALKMERLRVKISSDLHDDVGGLLSGLAMQSEILELTAKEESKPKLRRISELSRSAMSRMRDTVWAIDARQDKMEDLIDRMREHASEVLLPQNIQFDINTGQIDLNKKLAADIRQNLYLIYKEAITNVAKHSNGNQVIVLLENKQSHFKMAIQDNGDVQAKAYKTTGLGQANMKMRAEQIGAHLTTTQEQGFEVKLVMKRFL